MDNCEKLSGVLKVHHFTSSQFVTQTSLDIQAGNPFFSAQTPNLSKFIPAMDYINKHLASGALNMAYLPTIQAFMLIRKRLLNKYYNMMDYSEVYRITMGKLSFIYS